MNGPPRISIVTPSFNQGKYLAATLQSLVDQDYPNLEVIIQDGGSTDGSQGVARQFAAERPELFTLFVEDDDPLLFYRRIIDGCGAEGWLKPGGLLALECHRDATEQVADLIFILVNSLFSLPVAVSICGHVHLIFGWVNRSC